MCQSLHIGLNNYEKPKNKKFSEVYESHNDVERYTQLFKELRYDRVLTIIDE